MLLLRWGFDGSGQVKMTAIFITPLLSGADLPTSVHSCWKTSLKEPTLVSWIILRVGPSACPSISCSRPTTAFSSTIITDNAGNTITSSALFACSPRQITWVQPCEGYAVRSTEAPTKGKVSPPFSQERHHQPIPPPASPYQSLANMMHPQDQLYK